MDDEHVRLHRRLPGSRRCVAAGLKQTWIMLTTLVVFVTCLFSHSFSPRFFFFFHRDSRPPWPPEPLGITSKTPKETVAALLPGTGFVLLHHLLVLYRFFFFAYSASVGTTHIKPSTREKQCGGHMFSDSHVLSRIQQLSPEIYCKWRVAPALICGEV